MQPLCVRAVEDGTAAEIWRGEDLVGCIQVDGERLRLAVGDCEPDACVALVWSGEPFAVELDLSGVAGCGPVEAAAAAVALEGDGSAGADVALDGGNEGVGGGAAAPEG